MPAQLDDVSRTVGLVLGRRSVTADQRLVEDLGAESADILNIMVTLEEEYAVRIDETEMTNVATVRDLHRLLVKTAHGTTTPGPDAPRTA
jgi:acyl carrier protein